MLKACYVKLIDKTPPYSHKLGELAEEAGIYERLSPEQKNLLDELDPLNIEARYPKYKEKIHREFTIKKCQYIILKTEELTVWLRKNLTEK